MLEMNHSNVNVLKTGQVIHVKKKVNFCIHRYNYFKLFNGPYLQALFSFVKEIIVKNLVSFYFSLTGLFYQLNQRVAFYTHNFHNSFSFLSIKLHLL